MVVTPLQEEGSKQDREIAPSRPDRKATELGSALSNCAVLLMSLNCYQGEASNKRAMHNQGTTCEGPASPIRARLCDAK